MASEQEPQTECAVLVIEGSMVFPGQTKRVFWSCSKLIPEGKTSLEVLGPYFKEGSELACAIEAPAEGVGVITPVASEHLLFYQDVILCKINSITEKKDGLLDISLEGVSKAIVLRLRARSRRNPLPCPVAVDVIEMLPSPESESIDYDTLYAFAQLLKTYLDSHENDIPREDELILYSLSGRIFNLLQKSSKDLLIFETQLLEDIRSQLYNLATYYWRLPEPHDLQPLIAARDIRQEVRAALTILKHLMDVPDKAKALVPTEKSQKERYAVVKTLIHPDGQREIESVLKRITNEGKSQGIEHQTLEAWIEYVLDLPWGVRTDDNQDLVKAKEILETEHYGLEKAKNEIIKFLAVRKQNPTAKGKILTFIGPPGVGKTSLGKAIASALGRKFQRISLGSVSDEAVIRGHRRTYIGAMVGRIMKAIRNAGSENPIIMLDEIDKIREDHRGNPQDALMEVLDPEQNNEFEDHYVGFPFDLSKVLFICTANTSDTIHRPLRNRMRIIRLPGYFEHEKLEIVKRHLLPRQMKNTGLEGVVQVHIPDETLQKIITNYSLDPGLRDLERDMGAICEEISKWRQIDGNTDASFVITPDKLEAILDKPRRKDKANEATLVGEAIGLAVFPGYAAGDLLPIQCEIVPREQGKQVSYTGSMRRVMKESDKVALTCIRVFLKKSARAEYAEKSNIFKKNLIHIHAPNTAEPKDGPSAGVTMFVAGLSAILGIPVKPDIAMTGEIDIKFRVTAVGGIKEKILAAEHNHMAEVMIPKENEDDLKDVPNSIKDKIKIHLVGDLREAVQIAFAGLVSTDTSTDAAVLPIPTF